MYGLDALRFFAAFCVMLYHYSYSTWRAPVAPLEGAHWLFEYGYLGVNVFFGLSGFVICLSAEGASARTFVAHRFARLMPLLVVCGLITLGTLIVAGGDVGLVGDYLAGLTFLPGRFGRNFIDPVYWTLAYEVNFYALVFVLIVAGRFEKWLFAACVIWLLVGLWYAIGIWPSSRLNVYLNAYLAAPVAPEFIVGIALYLLVKRRGKVGPLLLCASATILSMWNDAHQYGGERGDWSLLFIAAIPTLLYFLATWKPSRWQRAFVLLGGASYPLYLVHENVGRTLIRHNAFLQTPLGCGAVLTTGMVLFACILAIADARIRRPVREVVYSLLSRPFQPRRV